MSHAKNLFADVFYFIILHHKTSSSIFLFSHYTTSSCVFLSFGLRILSVHKSACSTSGSSMNSEHYCHRLLGLHLAEGLLSQDLVYKHPKNDPVPLTFSWLSSFPKSTLEPSHCLDYLGLILDTAQARIVLPQKKSATPRSNPQTKMTSLDLILHDGSGHLGGRL